MIDKKTLLARCLVAGRVLSPIARIRAACRTDIPILAYHRVWDIADEDAFPFDVELVSAAATSAASPPAAAPPTAPAAAPAKAPATKPTK